MRGTDELLSTKRTKTCNVLSFLGVWSFKTLYENTKKQTKVWILGASYRFYDVQYLYLRGCRPCWLPKIESVIQVHSLLNLRVFLCIPYLKISIWCFRSFSVETIGPIIIQLLCAENMIAPVFFQVQPEICSKSPKKQAHFAVHESEIKTKIAPAAR